jgi:hypothetical protein
MVFNATFNNISVISCQPVLLVEETRVHDENHQPVASHLQTLSHKVVSHTLSHERDSNSKVVIGTDYIGSYQSNYHTFMTTTATQIEQVQDKKEFRKNKVQNIK